MTSQPPVRAAAPPGNAERPAARSGATPGDQLAGDRHKNISHRDDDWWLRRELAYLEMAPQSYSIGRRDTARLLGLPSAPPTRPTPTVEAEAELLRVRNEARTLVQAEAAGNIELPTVVNLTEFLATPDDPLVYRVDRLLPAGGRALLAAAYKAGKTTCRDNLLRSLVDGAPFLDEFAVAPPVGDVVLIDDELDPRQLRRWLRDQGINNTDRVRVIPLRGQVATFNLTDPALAARWAAQLAGCGFLIFDCLRPVLDAAGLSEDKDAGRFLVAFDELLRNAGIGEAVVVHHMGHNGERSRGDSRLRDWPDAEWRLVRQQPEPGEEPDPAAPRFFSAFGRDVNLAEGALTYDPELRRLTYAGGNRKETRDAGAVDAALPALLTVLAATDEPLSGRTIEERMRASGHGRAAVRGALDVAVREGEVVTKHGPRRSVLHLLKPLTSP